MKKIIFICLSFCAFNSTLALNCSSIIGITYKLNDNQIVYLDPMESILRIERESTVDKTNLMESDTSFIEDIHSRFIDNKSLSRNELGEAHRANDRALISSVFKRLLDNRNLTPKEKLTYATLFFLDGKANAALELINEISPAIQYRNIKILRLKFESLRAIGENEAAERILPLLNR